MNSSFLPASNANSRGSPKDLVPNRPRPRRSLLLFGIALLIAGSLLLFWAFPAHAQNGAPTITGMTLQSTEPGELTVTWDDVWHTYEVGVSQTISNLVGCPVRSSRPLCVHTRAPSHTFTDLEQGKVYEVRVRAGSRGPWSTESLQVSWYSADIPSVTTGGITIGGIGVVLERGVATHSYVVNWQPQDLNPDTLDLTLRADVVTDGGREANSCEGEGLGQDNNLYIIDEVVEVIDVQWGNTNGDCYSGEYTTVIILRDGNGKILRRQHYDVRVKGMSGGCFRIPNTTSSCGLPSRPIISADPASPWESYVVGKTLTADVSGISIPPTWRNVQFAYQWLSHNGVEETEIPGATLASYTVTQSDVGKLIMVRVDVSWTVWLPEGEPGSISANTDVAFSDYGKSLPTGVVNSPAAGAPTISGTPEVGETLTADISSISDADGIFRLPRDIGEGLRHKLTYQWLSSEDGDTDNEIDGATSPTYTLTDSDKDRTIKVRVSFNDARANRETLTSVATETVTRPPLNAEIHDKPQTHDGETPFTFELRFTQEPANGLSFRTIRDHVFEVTEGTIDGVGRMERGSSRRWRITVRPAGDADVVILQKPTTANCESWRAICTPDGTKLSTRQEFIVDGPAPEEEETANSVATGEPEIDGTAEVGSTLTATTSNIADADGMTNAVFTYQWLSGRDTEIDGATSSTYTLTDSDGGKSIKVRVNFTDDAGYEESLTSEATEAVTEAPPPNTAATGEPGIDGTAQMGATLTATTSNIADADGMTNAVFTYQWKRIDPNSAETEGEEIPGATRQTYTVTSDDVDKAIWVVVSFTDDADTVESIPSARHTVSTATEQQETEEEETDPEDTSRPYNLRAVVQGEAVVLTWEEPDVTRDGADDYRILRHRPELGEPEPLMYVDTYSSATTYTDTGVEPGVLYVYHVHAVINFLGDLTEASDPVEIRTPGQPTEEEEEEESEEQESQEQVVDFDAGDGQRALADARIRVGDRGRKNNENQDRAWYATDTSDWHASGELLDGSLAWNGMTVNRVVYFPDTDVFRFNDPKDAFHIGDSFEEGGVNRDLTVWVQTETAKVSFVAKDHIVSHGESWINFRVPEAIRTTLDGIATGDEITIAVSVPN